jgi:hypothetical protein
VKGKGYAQAFAALMKADGLLDPAVKNLIHGGAVAGRRPGANADPARAA